jgi:hypothetical protein
MAPRTSTDHPPTWQLAIDCREPALLIPFWCEALGYVPEPPPAGFDSHRAYWLSLGHSEEDLGDADGSDAIVDPDGARPRIFFQAVPEDKAGKNRLHVDIKLTGGPQRHDLAERRALVDAEVERLCALGASIAWVNTPDGADFYAVTLRDPEGNEFCVV